MVESSVGVNKALNAGPQLDLGLKAPPLRDTGSRLRPTA
jgi:hypothetical protein